MLTNSNKGLSQRKKKHKKKKIENENAKTDKNTSKV